jgi:hypothetical protein
MPIVEILGITLIACAAPVVLLQHFALSRADRGRAGRAARH